MVNLVMLGTGHAMVTKCYNTCFIIETDKGSIMVDAGGGNTILTQVEKSGIDWSEIKALFITHAHTDHIIGCIWVLRQINSLMKHGKYSDSFKVYGIAENLEYLKYSCSFLLSDCLNDNIHFIPISDGHKFSECNIDFEAFDIASVKKQQLGFKAFIRENDKEIRLACLGDEPYHDVCERHVKNADWLLSEAFCLHSEKDLFHPYEKCHSTAYDAGIVAKALNVKNLLIYHTEDSDLANRSAKYTAEAKQNFDGNIFVPNDLEVIGIL